MKRFLIKRRIPLTLAVVLGTELAFVGFGVFPEAIFSAALGVLAIAAFLAAFSGERFDAWLFGALALAWLVTRIVFPSVDAPTLLLRTASTTAFTLLNLLLLIGPWSRFSDRFLPLVRHRRRLGVTVFFCGLTHGLVASRTLYSFDYVAEIQSVFPFFGITALYLFTFLALTSWDWVQTHVSPRIWGVIHALVLLGYAGFVLSFVWILRASQVTVALWMWVFFTVAIVYGIALAPWGPVARRMRVVMGWKQLHALIWIAWASVMAHSWTGIVAYQDAWVRAPYLLLASFVIASHVAGWIRKAGDEQEAVERVRRVGKEFTEASERWIGIGRTPEFVAGKGERVIVAGRPLAIFRFMDRFIALSAVCAHQKGPIDRGKIDRDGYVTCPWHGWQYSTADGCGPPGYRGDCVPLYPTQVREGIVYVRERAAEPPGGAVAHGNFL